MAQKKKPSTTKSSAAKNTPAKKSGQPASRQTQLPKDDRAHRQISAILLFACAILSLCISLIPGSALWAAFHSFALGVFGIGVFLWPAALVYVAVICALDKPVGKISNKLMQAAGLICLICSAVYIFTIASGSDGGYFHNIADTYLSFSNVGGGAAGALIGGAFFKLFGKIPAAIVVLLLAFVFLMFTTGTTLINLFKMLWSPVKKIENHAVSRMDRTIEEEAKLPKRFNIDVPVDGEPVEYKKEKQPSRAEKKRRAPFDVPVDLYVNDAPEQESAEPLTAEIDFSAQDDFTPTALDDLIKNVSEPAPEKPAMVRKKPEEIGQPTEDKHELDKPESTETEEVVPAYRFPPVDLLVNSVADGDEDVEEELKSNAAKLVDTLKSFGVETTIIGISRGPAVTRYELKPASGVKINKITNLADDIALNLAASGVRIEAPIPNKSAVGIEIPNRTTSVVPMRELIDSPKFTGGRSKLTVVLGKDITGNVTVADLAKMPHLLIAGSTGSGKSVCINSLIISVLYKATPDEVKLLMIDPKVVELGVYNGIPHLLVPVVTDPRKASGALSWAVNEMLNRYKIFADNNVRDLNAYNKMCANCPEKKPLPQVLIIIDELADLMMAAPNEVEDSICRLAQMARAAGMHLVIATQRPSVDVITGIIKANIPSRIAFAVSSQVDSRTILDTSGAEKLLGRGDMLFYPVGASKPTRVQGCYVNDDEIESVIEYIKNSSSVEECVYDENIAKEIERQAAPEKKKGGSSGGSEGAGDFGDEMLPQAIECVIEMGTASTTLLQRRLRLGYARAARIMDELEQRGIVSPAEGSKQRKVLITKQQWLEMSTRTDDDEV